MRRRQYLAGLTTGIALGTAGCLGLLGDSDGGGGDGRDGNGGRSATPTPAGTVSIGGQEETPSPTDRPTATPEPTPTRTPTPEPAQPLATEPRAEPVTFSGGATDADEEPAEAGTIDLTPGPVIADYSHERGKFELSGGVHFESSQPCDCRFLDTATEAAEKQVEYTATAEWDVTIRQPRPVPESSPPVETLSMEGTGNEVLGPFRLAGDYRIDGERTDYPLHVISIYDHETLAVPTPDQVHVVGPGDWPREFSHDGVVWIEVDWIHVNIDAGWWFNLERQ